MVLNSSTFNFKDGRNDDTFLSIIVNRRFFIITAVILGLAWLGNALVGDALGRFAAAHFGSTIANLGGSKVPDITEFVAARLTDALWLTSLVWAGCVLIAAIGHRITKSRSQLAPWIAGVGLFIALNVWCLLAAQTALFWLILRGTSVENQAQFHTKENLMREVKIRPLIAVVGSSQSQAQFTAEIFNSEVAGKAWMMEFWYPGSGAADVFFVGERFSPKYVTDFVYYISFTNIYALGRDSSSARDLLRLRDLPQSLSIGAWRFFYPTTARYTALGMISPLFQYRASFQHALLGPTALPPKIVAAPKLTSSDIISYGFSDEAEYQKAAFRRFIEHSASKGQRVIVIVGQMNPDYEALLSPVIHQDFQDFLKDCAATYPNLTLVWQNELLVQPPEAYRDHAHVTPETSEKFSKAFAKWYLQHSLPSPKPIE